MEFVRQAQVPMAFDPNSGNTGSYGSGGGSSEIVTAPNAIPYTTDFKHFESGRLDSKLRGYLNSDTNIRNYTDRYLIENDFSRPSQFTAEIALEFGNRFELDFEQYRWVFNNRTILFEEFQNFLFSNADFKLTKAAINQFLQNPDIKWNEFEPTLNFVNKFLEDHPDTLDKEDIFNRIKALDLLLIQNPDALLDIQCQELPKWKTVANHPIPQSVKDKLKSINDKTHWYDTDATIQSLQGVKGKSVNMDLFEVKIETLPKKPNSNVRYTPKEFFDYFRLNINTFVDPNNGSFTPIEDNYYNIHDTKLWNSANPLNVLISIYIPISLGVYNNGTVICSGVNSDYWVFTTISSPWDWGHPVSGNRFFGYRMEGNTMVLYTRGVDRVNLPVFNALDAKDNPAFQGADILWTGMQLKVAQFINKRESDGIALIPAAKKHRPDWANIEGYLKGIQTLNSIGCK